MLNINQGEDEIKFAFCGCENNNSSGSHVFIQDHMVLPAESLLFTKFLKYTVQNVYEWSEMKMFIHNKILYSQRLILHK